MVPCFGKTQDRQKKLWEGFASVSRRLGYWADFLLSLLCRGALGSFDTIDFAFALLTALCRWVMLDPFVNDRS